MKRQQSRELEELRQRVIDLETSAKTSKQAEEALRASEERFRRYFELGLIGMAITSPTKGIIEVNKKICEILGYERSELLEKSWEELTHPDDLAADVTNFNRVLAGEIDGYALDKRWIRRDGRVVNATISVKCLRRADGSVDYFVALLQDITERKEAEDALQQRTLELQHLTETLEERVKERSAELADLSLQLVSAQEKERRRISYDLHDNVWQSLEIIKSKIEHLSSEEDKTGCAALHEKSKQLIPLIRNTVAKIRSMQGDLWPSVLDDIGILATLEWYCREFRANHPALSIERHVDAAEEEVPVPVKIVIYRVMQEALSNVTKHSQATHVSLSLIKNDHHVKFTVRDDGIGFNVGETIVKRSPWGGVGL